MREWVLPFLIPLGLYQSLLFVQQKAYGLFDFKASRHNYSQIKIIEKPKTIFFPDRWFLSCNNKF